jgi:hypothetical protein
MYRLIGVNLLLSNLLMFLFYTGYFSYFAYSLSKTEPKLLTQVYVVMFVFYTVLYGINIFRRLYNLYYIISNYGKTVPLIIYNKNSRDRFTMFGNIKMFIIEAVLLSHFYPRFTKCAEYGYNTELCSSLRIIVYSFEITLTITILVLLLVTFIVLISLCNNSIDRRVILKLLDFINFPKEILRKIKIIKFHPFNRLCNICLEDHNDKVNWISLSCSHKFHHECIKAWKEENKSCPICNTEINIISDSLLSINI